MKSILMVAALAVASLSVVSAKSYEFTLNNPTAAGQTELRAGHYLVKVNGAYAEFFNIDNRHTVMVPVKVEAAKVCLTTPPWKSKPKMASPRFSPSNCRTPTASWNSNRPVGLLSAGQAFPRPVLLNPFYPPENRFFPSE